MSGLVVLSNGQIVCAGDTLQVLDINKPKGKELLYNLQGGHSRAINGVAILPNDQVISVSHDKVLALWNVNTGKLISTLCGHHGFVLSVAALSDGRVISGSQDNTLKIWDVSTGKCLRTLNGHSGAISSPFLVLEYYQTIL